MTKSGAYPQLAMGNKRIKVQYYTLRKLQGNGTAFLSAGIGDYHWLVIPSSKPNIGVDANARGSEFYG
jgi:hypothetical protein